MKFETLKQNRKKKFVIGLVVFIAIIATISLVGSKAKYRTTQSIKIVEGTIRNYSPADFNVLAIKLKNEDGEYESSDTIPESGYVLNETESYCTIPDGSGNNINDSSITLEYKDGEMYFGKITKKGTKCYLYFDIYVPTASDIILANMTTITTRSSFSSTVTASSTGTIYTAEDDDGTSYYFAGNPTDNWVKFAGFYWRIIRINGDGTIRMIYQGTAANTTGTGTQTTTSAFNSTYNNNMYVGYMYTSGQVHGTGTASTIKGVLDSWYDSNLASYASYIDTNAGFCGDRTPSTSSSSSNGSGGTGTTPTYYGDYIRYYNSGTPVLTCANSSDLYTVSSSSKGNKALSKPIGLINMNEVWLGGDAPGRNNASFYLYTGQYYWTMSPSKFSSSSSRADVFYVNSNGNLNDSRVDNAFGVRPVINLKSDTAFADGGTGTSSNPYVVS